MKISLRAARANRGAARAVGLAGKPKQMKGATAMAREQTTIRLKHRMLDALRAEADRRGYTVNDLIVFLLWEHVRSTSSQE